MYLHSRGCCTVLHTYNNWCTVSYFLVPYFPYCKSNALMFVIYIKPHTTGSCPESTDLLPAVVALGVVLAIVVLLLAVAILTIVFLYISESDVKLLVCVLCVCVCMCVHFKGMSLSDH